MAVRSAVINVMAGAAYKAARAIVRDFGEVENLQVSRKGPADFVSATDIRAERILRTELARARPGYGFLLEEGGRIDGKEDARWIIDPLDGTLNFLHGIPHFALSIGLERGGALVAGVVYDPLRDELYWAEKGAGAYVNDRRLRVSARTALADAAIGTGLPPGADAERFLAEVRALITTGATFRRQGSAALDLAYVAAGRFDAFWESGLSPWDVAAGTVLVREAGGYVSDVAGGSEVLGASEVVAANPDLHHLLCQLFARTRG